MADLEDLTLESLEYTVLVDRSSEILIVDDEEIIHKVLERFLDNRGYVLESASTGEEALLMMQNKAYALVLIDKNLPGLNGLEVLRIARERGSEAEFIMVTGFASYESAVEAMRLGAFDYVEKPFRDLGIVAEKIAKALEKHDLTHENRVLAEHLRSAHRQLNAEARGAGTDADPAPSQARFGAMLAHATRELEAQNERLQAVLAEAGDIVREGRACIDEARAAGTNGPEVLRAVGAIIDRALWALSRP